MSIPTEDELAPLISAKDAHDDETFHIEYDEVLEAKLKSLDPEWMKAMTEYYESSRMDRWCA